MFEDFERFYIVPYFRSWFQEQDTKRGQSTRLEEDIQHRNFGMKLEKDRLQCTLFSAYTFSQQEVQAYLHIQTIGERYLSP